MSELIHSVAHAVAPSLDTCSHCTPDVSELSVER